jgi:hypothetical protein
MVVVGVWQRESSKCEELFDSFGHYAHGDSFRLPLFIACTRQKKRRSAKQSVVLVRVHNELAAAILCTRGANWAHVAVAAGAVLFFGFLGELIRRGPSSNRHPSSVRRHVHSYLPPSGDAMYTPPFYFTQGRPLFDSV